MNPWQSILTLQRLKKQPNEVISVSASIAFLRKHIESNKEKAQETCEKLMKIQFGDLQVLSKIQEILEVCLIDENIFYSVLKAVLRKPIEKLQNVFHFYSNKGHYVIDVFLSNGSYQLTDI